MAQENEMSNVSLRILLSVYACEPGKGSEPGVGWRWAIEMARLGHDVCVLTRQNNRVAIERALQIAPLPGIEFIYYDLPSWARRWKRNGRGVHLYYLQWQIGAYHVASRAHAAHPFDAVHHLTFGVLRQPSLMGRLGIPFVVGPLGGGETAPLALRQSFPLRSRFSEWLRDLSNRVCRHDPLVRSMLQHADIVLCKTPESLAWIPERYRAHSRCLLEIGVDVVAEEKEPSFSVSDGSRPALRLVFVGRFLVWKGMDLGLRALALLRERGVDATLTMIGQGPAKDHWQALAVELDIAAAIDWVPWMEREKLMDAYASFDALLFPSLHDSSGNVVLESMANGLPVVCLDLGGPAQIVNEECGVIIDTRGLSVDQVADSLAWSLEYLARWPAWRKALRKGTRRRVIQFEWKTVVGRVWSDDGVGTALVHAARERARLTADADAFADADPRARPAERTARRNIT
jgi:glycosyltransferase involved in cell wall biosynthesis